MIDAGIVDPAKVTRSALQNASSASAMLLTTEAGITDIPSEEPAMPMGEMGIRDRLNITTEYIYDRFGVFGKTIDTNKSAMKQREGGNCNCLLYTSRCV